MERIVYGFYLPGFTEPEEDVAALGYLTSRDIWEPTGGARLMFGFRNKNEIDVRIRGPKEPCKMDHDESYILASCVLHNCRATIQWRVEYRDATCAWSAYLGVWNEEIAVAILNAPDYVKHPYVWTSRDIEGMKRGYRLLDY